LAGDYFAEGDSRMSIAARAKLVYEGQLKERLEAEHCDRYVAIEPDSEAYFLGDSFLDAALAAKAAYPERTSFVVRIGHEAAFHIGASWT
jgi:hypothetical protein